VLQVLCSLLSFCRCKRTSRSGTLEKDLRSDVKPKRSQEEEEEEEGGMWRLGVGT